MVEAVLYVLTGTLLSAGTHHLYLGTTRTASQLQLAAMYLLLAGFVLASAFLYQSQENSVQAHMARLSMTLGILLWIALIWHVAFYSRFKPLLLLDLLTAAWAIFLIRNMSPAHALLYAEAAAIEQTLPAGENLSALTAAGINSWWTAVNLTTLASLLFSAYASLRMFRSGNKQGALALAFGLSVLMASSLADHLLNSRLTHTLYLAPFGFIGFLMVNSLYPLLLDYQKRRKAIQAPLIYSLTFNPERASFDTHLSNLQSPPAGEPEMTVAQVPEPESATSRQANPSSAFLPAAKGRRLRREGALVGHEAVDVVVSDPGTKAGSQDSGGETGTEASYQQHQTPISKRGQSSLNTVSDNLIDIAVYATMALKRFGRGDADPQVLEMLCRKIRSKAIKTRRMANSLSRPGAPGNDAL